MKFEEMIKVDMPFNEALKCMRAGKVCMSKETGLVCKIDIENGKEKLKHKFVNLWVDTEVLEMREAVGSWTIINLED